MRKWNITQKCEGAAPAGETMRAVTVLMIAALAGSAPVAQVPGASIRVPTPSPTTALDEPIAGTASIRGRIVDGGGQPVRKALVLAGRSSPPVTRDGAVSGVVERSQFSARTDGDGYYELTRLPPGRYLLSAQREGYVQPPVRVTVGRVPYVDLADGGTVGGHDLTLWRGGVVSGTVLDDRGEPVVKAQVLAYLRQSVAGRPMHPAGNGAMTDDRGSFRIYGLEPGLYTVRATPPDRRSLGAYGEIQGDRAQSLPAFAPSGSEPAEAEFVRVDVGDDVGLDVRLGRGHVARLSGVVAIDPPAPPRVHVTLRSADPTLSLHQAAAQMAADGTFVLHDIPPGHYVLVAEGSVDHDPKQPARRAPLGSVMVSVDGRDLDDLVVPLTPGATVRGRVEVEGGNPEDLARRGVHLYLRGLVPGINASGPVHATVAPDRTFEASGVRNRMRVDAMNLPEGWWVKSVSVEGEDATLGHEFPIRGTVDDVVVVVSGAPTGVTGLVQAPPDALRGALVFVVPQAGNLSLEQFQTLGRLQPVRPDGSFRAGGVRPGRYVVAAVTQTMFERWREGPLEALPGVVSRGTPVDVTEGQFMSVTLRLLAQTPE